MPYARRRSNSSRRRRRTINRRSRRFRRRLRSRGSPRLSTMRNRLTSVFPSRLLTKCKWSFWNTFQTTSSLYNYKFRMNSIWDPDASSITGHSAIGYNQLFALYNSYRVFAFKFRVQFIMNSLSGTPPTPVWIAILPTRNVGFTSIDTIIEETLSKSKLYDSANKNVLSSKINIASFFGKTRNEFIADDYNMSAFGTNPASSAVMQLFTQSTGAANYSTTIKVNVVYYVECFDPTTLPSS